MNQQNQSFLEIPYSLDEVTNIVVETIRQNKLSNGYIRLVVSRGAGNLGLDPDSCKKPNVVVIAEQLSLFHKNIMRKGFQL